ncbi:MAG: SMP-30/gluconolactonase/LRE family protein, partial [Rhizobiales bacterium]|nr:SMP-30/gluconolactonase/LRE family protein [Hyphomicrobiales bacterium]
MSEIVCVVDAGAELGEGTLWDPDLAVLWWLDIWGRRIHRHDPATGRNDSWETPEFPGCLGIRSSGGLVMSMGGGFHFFDPDSGTFAAIIAPEAGRPEIRFNDGKV